MFSLMRLVASVAFLNALLTLHNIWPTPWVKVVPELSVELFAALLAMAEREIQTVTCTCRTQLQHAHFTTCSFWRVV